MRTVVCRYGSFKFEVMPFGLMNAPSTFQRMVDKVLCSMPFARVYLDDVVVFSANMEDHMKHVREVFGATSTEVLKLKIIKCNFAMHSLNLLRHVVDATGANVGEGKVAIRGTPIPTSATELRIFLGLAGL